MTTPSEAAGHEDASAETTRQDAIARLLDPDAWDGSETTREARRLGSVAEAVVLRDARRRRARSLAADIIALDPPADGAHDRTAPAAEDGISDDDFHAMGRRAGIGRPTGEKLHVKMARFGRMVEARARGMREPGTERRSRRPSSGRSTGSQTPIPRS